MATSRVSYTGNGSTGNFTVTFPYLAKSHVKVYVDNVEDTSFTWLTASSIQISPVPADGAYVLIKRSTPTSPLVDFVDGANLSESDLDLAKLQALYVAEEAVDEVAGGLFLNQVTLTWDALGYPLINLAEPTNPQDAVTKNYVDTSMTSQVVLAESYAQAAQSAAEAAASAVSVFTISASDPTGGVNGDVWFKVPV